MSVRLDRLQKGLFSVIGTALGNDVSVQWGYGSPIKGQLKGDLVSIKLSSGPSKQYVTRPRTTAFLPPDSIVLSVSTASIGKRYGVELNQHLFYYDSILGDTTSSIISNVVSQINSDSYDPFTASIGPLPGEFTILPDSLGSIWQASITDLISTSSITLSTSSVGLTQGSRRLGVNIQTFSKNIDTFNGAWSLMDSIQDISENEELMDELYNEYGINIIDFGTPIDISEIAGASWETRMNADITINMQSNTIRPIDTIGEVNFTITSKTFGTNQEIITSGSIGE